MGTLVGYSFVSEIVVRFAKVVHGISVVETRSWLKAKVEIW